MKKLASRKLWITLICIAIAGAAPLWISDSVIYAALVGFLAAQSGLYGWANNKSAETWQKNAT